MRGDTDAAPVHCSAGNSDVDQQIIRDMNELKPWLAIRQEDSGVHACMAMDGSTRNGAQTTAQAAPAVKPSCKTLV